LFSSVPLAPPDEILGIAVAFAADTDPKKVNLGIGAYRDNDGKPVVLPVVRRVEQEMAADKTANHEYLTQDGLPEFRTLTARLIMGEHSPALAQNRVVTCQALSGTGALRLGFAFIKQFFPADLPPVLISNPTWGNHKTIINHAGLKFAEYPYYKQATNGLDLEGMLGAFRAAPNGSVVLLHPCAHNPTGVDPSQEQWRAIADVIREKNHFPFFDCAYQGFATGSLDGDAFSVRLFDSQGFEMLVTQSYAKNFGLYGERIGALNVVTRSPDAVAPVASQLKLIARAMYSNPPKHGAVVVAKVLGSPELRALWEVDLKGMSERIIAMRKRLFARLQSNGCPGTWHHIVDQIGMFSYTGLNKEQCAILTDRFHIYLVNNGRISMAGLNEHNVDYVADAIKVAVAGH